MGRVGGRGLLRDVGSYSSLLLFVVVRLFVVVVVWWSPSGLSTTQSACVSCPC